LGRKAAAVAADGAMKTEVETRASVPLPMLLSRTHLRNHLRKAIGGNRYKVSENLFIPGHSSDRATLWLAGHLFDMEVIAPIKEGTGTGRYIKHQSGTTAGLSNDAR